MLFEDVHWADPTSLDLLDRIINWAQRTRVLVLITFRPEFLVPWHHHSHVTSLTLSRITRKLAAAMVTEVAGERKLSDSICDQIVAKTDGIPLFVEELTQAVVESQEFQSRTGDAQQALGPSLAIPDTLQDSLAARLDRIGPAKEVVQVGAVIGREFSHDLVALLGGFSDETVRNALETALGSGVVFRRGAPPEATYTFKHALVRDAAYEMLLNRRRRQLHGRLGDLFESRTRRGGSEIQPELLAHHFTEAGRVEQAVAYWSKAGKAAIDRYANMEAVGHFRKGLELLGQLPEGPVRDQRELELLIGLGHGLQGSAGSAVSEAGVAYRRARTLAQQTGDPQQQSEILQGLRMFHLTRGELSAARSVGEELQLLGEHLQDAGLLMEGHRALGGVLVHMGELMLARTHLEAAYALYDPVEHRRHAAQYDTDPGVTALHLLSLALWPLGFPQQARARIEQAVVLARASSHPLSLFEALFWDAELGRYLFDLQHVRERVEEEISLATEHNLQMWVCLARYQHGWAMVHQGEPENGITQMRRSFTEALSLEHGLMSLWAAPLVEAYEKVGLVEEGLAAADEGLEAVDRAGGSLHESELYRLKGKLLFAQGVQVDEAETCVRRALDVARRQNAKSYELRAAVTMAQFLCDRGERREAHDLVALVYDWFTEGFDTPDLCEAKTLLEELS
jgi:tetratricopeptide (TPR) repeat protein